jgi:hypothetical protein
MEVVHLNKNGLSGGTAHAAYRLHEGLHRMGHESVMVVEFLDYWLFVTGVLRSTPIVWTLQDLNPPTGGCHYDFGCERYATHCGPCPQLGSGNAKDLSREVWKRKQRVRRV